MTAINRRMWLAAMGLACLLAGGVWYAVGHGEPKIGPPKVPTIKQALVESRQVAALAAEDDAANNEAPVQLVAQKKKKPNGDHPFPRRQAAPELDGGQGWINTSGPLTLADLKGKFVLLDFWTYCCINCMHILPELKKLEQAYPNQIVVIGVHSAKFATEEDSQNISEAVLRYEIEHPVINDANHVIWDKFKVNSWPSLRVIDPEGDVIAGDSGEVTFEALDQFFKQAIPYYKENGFLDETPIHFELEAHSATDTPLRFPGKVLADEAGDRLFIADSNHNRIVITKLDGTLLETIGSGAIGRNDGGYEQCSFNKPQGMALMGETLYVADTESHLLRKVDLEQQRVVTIAGLGRQGQNAWPGLDRKAVLNFGQKALPKRFIGVPIQTEINSPWDLLVHEDDLYIAMAGPHQIWKMTLDEKEIGPYAGNAREDIVDGPLLPTQPYAEGFSSFAQPSGLASDGEFLYVADSEGSSIRAVPFNPKDKVKTVVGTSHLGSGRLFKFGDIDGEGRGVRLQHPLGVAYRGGKLYVADTYNNKIKVLDPQKKSCKAIAGQLKPGNTDDPAAFDEPAGLSAAAGKLYVADTNNHAIRVIELDSDYRVSTLNIADLQPPEPPAASPAAPEDPGTRVAVDSQDVKAVDNTVALAVKLQLPEGYKVNPKAPMSYRVKPATPLGAVDRAAIGKTTKLSTPAAEFEIPLPVAMGEGDTLDVTVTYYYCKDGPGGLCKMGRVTWTVPFTLAADATATALPLVYAVE